MISLCFGNTQFKAGIIAIYRIDNEGWKENRKKRRKSHKKMRDK